MALTDLQILCWILGLFAPAIRKDCDVSASLRKMTSRPTRLEMCAHDGLHVKENTDLPTTIRRRFGQAIGTRLNHISYLKVHLPNGRTVESTVADLAKT